MHAEGEGKAHDRRKEYPFEGSWIDKIIGVYELSYIAEQAGTTELHVWCDPFTKGERISPPGFAVLRALLLWCRHGKGFSGGRVDQQQRRWISTERRSKQMYLRSLLATS